LRSEKPRTTGDVDVIVYGSTKTALDLVDGAIAAGFAAQVDVERARLEATGTLRFRKGLFQLDVILASLPFEDEALARASSRQIFGRFVPIPTPEDLILLKVLAGRDKDLVDAAGVMRRHRATLDLGYIEGHLQALGDLAEDMTAWGRWQALRHTTGL
jgi:hypothetical protein